MRRAVPVVAAVLWLGLAVGAAEKKPRMAPHNYVFGAGHPWVQSALERAAAKLREPGCRRVFSDFSDRYGVSLDRKLQTLGVAPEEYLMNWISFMDGNQQPLCRNRDIAAFTETGSRVVFVCSSRILANRVTDGHVIIIHEMLHSIGLQENPPTPAAITRQVALRCRG